MKKVIDNFSGNSEIYKKFRPSYPEDLYPRVLKFVSERDTCWDCGTGNGQVASELAKFFTTVYATDISENQLAHAEKKKNIIYKVERAEKTGFPDNLFDLITVAQAIHWLDHQAFAKEVKRVLKPTGVLAYWGYSLVRITPEVDEIIDGFYAHTIGPYWNAERNHVDEKYASIHLGFQKLSETQNLNIQYDWTVETIEGYINSWSGVKNYRNANDDDPVFAVMKRLKKIWHPEETKKATFSIFMKIERVEK